MLRKEMEDYMAKIVKTDMQEEALKVIKENLKVLAGINAVLIPRKKNPILRLFQESGRLL